jgi:hypothetical protein
MVSGVISNCQASRRPPVAVLAPLDRAERTAWSCAEAESQLRTRHPCSGQYIHPAAAVGFPLGRSHSRRNISPWWVFPPPLPFSSSSSCLRTGTAMHGMVVHSAVQFFFLFLQQEQRRSRALRPRQDWVEDWVRSNDTLVRGLSILVGGVSLVAVLLNRAVSGIAAVSDASRYSSKLLIFSTCCRTCKDLEFEAIRSLVVANHSPPISPSNSSQSRADILTLALSVTDILAGLVWLSIRPKSITPVREN